MRLLRTVFTRLLLLVAMVAGGTTAAASAAQAATPDVWGFAYVDTSSGIPNPTYQAGSWGAGSVTVTPGVPGEYFVRFPGIGIPTGGIAHVTAISQTAEWCQIEKWGQSGADEIVAVRCYRYGGGPAKALFSIVFASSSGALASASQAYGYVFWNGSTIASHYNSALAVNTVTPTSTGVWTVWMPGLGSAVQAGNVQVTAVDSGQPARCKVGAWSWAASGQKFQVLCHNATNVPLDTGWTITYQRERSITGAFAPPKYFAYTFDNTPANPGPYAPVPTGVNFNYPGAVNTVQSSGTGMRLVTFPKVGILPNNVQVTAYGPGPAFCNLQTLWTTAGSVTYVRNVVCYNATTALNQPSLLTYTSKA